MTTDEQKIHNWHDLLNGYKKKISDNQLHLLRDRIQRLEVRKSSMERAITNQPKRIDKASLLQEIKDTDQIIHELSKKLLTFD